LAVISCQNLDVFLVISTGGPHASLCHFDRRPKAGAEKSGRGSAVASCAPTNHRSDMILTGPVEGSAHTSGYMQRAARFLDFAPLEMTRRRTAPLLRN
jgi:hypothetical protein